MMCEYDIRWDGDDLVCSFVVGADWAEVFRFEQACKGHDELCSIQISLCQLQCELHAGQLLPWIVPVSDDDHRVCWTGPLASFGPVMIGFSDGVQL